MPIRPLIRRAITFAVALLLLGGTALAEEPPEAGDAVETPHRCRLEYTQSGINCENMVGYSDHAEPVFKKEPEYEGVAAKGLTSDGDNAVGYAWDQEARKLYIDANRNWDLTDDTPIELTGGGTWHFQERMNVRIDVPPKEGPRSYVLDVQAMGPVFLTLRSGWQGDVRLYGRDWRITLADLDLNGVFDSEDLCHVRPLDIEQPRVVTADLADSVNYADRLFLDGHCYALAPEWTADGAIDLALTEQAVEQALLEVRGEGLGFVLLEGGVTVMLWQPGPSVPVPCGIYNTQQFMVDGGAAQFAAQGWQPLRVNAEGAALEAGGPLTQKLSVSRNLARFSFSHAIQGVGGRIYEQIGGDYENPPQVRVYDTEGKLLDECQFAYG